MSIFNRGHLFGLIAAVAIAGCSSTEEATEDAGASAGTGTTATESVSTGGETSNLLSQRVVYFDFDKSAIRADAYEALQAHAQYLANHQGSTIRIEGHADERGTREYNMALGERRANAVRDYMVANGIASFRIETISYGEERPVAYGSGEANWAQNRRVELKPQ